MQIANSVATFCNIIAMAVVALGAMLNTVNSVKQSDCYIIYTLGISVMLSGQLGLVAMPGASQGIPAGIIFVCAWAIVFCMMLGHLSHDSELKKQAEEERRSRPRGLRNA